MYFAWTNYGDSTYESSDINEIINWLELNENEIEELNNAIEQNVKSIDFNDSGIEW